MKIRNILISQPKPESDKNPYTELAKKYNVTIDFRSFVKVEGLSAREFRSQRINIQDHKAVILNSRNAVDHFFALCKELRVTIPEDMLYFCVTEAVALYLQKYIQYRKRKIFHGQSKFEDLLDVMKKHKDKKFLFVCSDKHQDIITDVLTKNKYHYSKAIMYRTVSSDLSDLTDVWYDMVVFFSHQGIESLYENFPKFIQGEKVIGTFGLSVKKTAEEAGLHVECFAPSPKAPSMAMAIDQFLAERNGKGSTSTVVAKTFVAPDPKPEPKVSTKTKNNVAKKETTKKAAAKPAAKKAAAKPAAKKPAAKPAAKPAVKKAAAKPAARKAAPAKKATAAKPAAKKTTAAKPAAKKAATPAKKTVAKPAAKKTTTAAAKKAAPAKKATAAKPAAKKATTTAAKKAAPAKKATAAKPAAAKKPAATAKKTTAAKPAAKKATAAKPAAKKAAPAKKATAAKPAATAKKTTAAKPAAKKATAAKPAAKKPAAKPAARKK